MLNQLGKKYELKIKLNNHKICTELQRYQSDWKVYNPRKINFGRYGLSMTSLDGSIDGIPDLDSLKEYNSINGTAYTEASFKQKTELVKIDPTVEELFNLFGESVSRSHFIKFNKGGFFPPHRDINLVGNNGTFRLFSLITNARDSDYHFVLDGELQHFKAGAVYFIDTNLEHSLVSFADDLVVMVMNIDLTVFSADIVIKNLSVR